MGLDATGLGWVRLGWVELELECDLELEVESESGSESELELELELASELEFRHASDQTPDQWMTTLAQLKRPQGGSPEQICNSLC